MEQQSLLFTTDVNQTVTDLVKGITFDKLYILTDTHTHAVCMPYISEFCNEFAATSITVSAGDVAKNVESLCEIWRVLSSTGATRQSLLINLGGGMITDMGGFAAATFKRGFRFINLPTTLLGAVDAAVGGKTGINFNGLKNEIGVFCTASHVIISSQFFETLNQENLLSGYAEMLKHGLLDNDKHYDKLVAFSLHNYDATLLLKMVEESVKIKERVVEQDPCEKGIRKALNLGHTVGHAFESYCLHINKPILHGYAVAWGLVCELILSHRQCGFPQETLMRTARFVKENYGVLPFTCKQYDQLYEYMTHDKKNEGDTVNFTLLKGIGQISINQTASREQIDIMFDIYRDLFGI